MTLNHLNKNQSVKKSTLLIRNENLVKEVARLKKENREIRILYHQLNGTNLRFHTFDKEVQTDLFVGEEKEARNTKSMISPIKVREKSNLVSEQYDEKNINISNKKIGKTEENKIDIINKENESIKYNDKIIIIKNKSNKNINSNIKSNQLENSMNNLNILSSSNSPKKEIQDKSFKILDESFKFIKSNKIIDNEIITSSPDINVKEIRRNTRRPINYNEHSQKVKMRSSFQFTKFAPVDSLKSLPQNNILSNTKINQIEEDQCEEANTEDIILQITKSNDDKKANRKFKKKKQ